MGKRRSKDAGAGFVTGLARSVMRVWERGERRFAKDGSRGRGLTGRRLAARGAEDAIVGGHHRMRVLCRKKMPQE